MPIRVFERTYLSAFKGLRQVEIFLGWVQDQVWMICRHQRPPRPLSARFLEPDLVAFARDHEMASALVDGVHRFTVFSSSVDGILSHHFVVVDSVGPAI